MEGSLFCFVVYEIHRTGMLQIAFLVVFGKSSMRRTGALGFGSMMFGLALQKFLNIE